MFIKKFSAVVTMSNTLQHSSEVVCPDFYCTMRGAHDKTDLSISNVYRGRETYESCSFAATGHTAGDGLGSALCSLLYHVLLQYDVVLS